MSEEVQGWAAVPNWVVRDPEIDPLVKLLYLVLSSRAGRKGVCWPSQERLAQETGRSVRTVQRYLDQMRESGLLEVVTEVTPVGRRNRYRLLADDGLDPHTTRVSPPHPNEGEDTTPVSGGDTTPVSHKEEPLEEPSTSTTSSPVATPPREPTPATHPSRRMTNDWAPSVTMRDWLLERYNLTFDQLREIGRRFVAHHISKGTTSRSWEAEFTKWVSTDAERYDEKRQGTDDRGVPYGQRPRTNRAAQPGDPDYVDPEELARKAREATQDPQI